jgi:hypothetical protein
MGNLGACLNNKIKVRDVFVRYKPKWVVKLGAVQAKMREYNSLQSAHGCFGWTINYRLFRKLFPYFDKKDSREFWMRLAANEETPGLTYSAMGIPIAYDPRSAKLDARYVFAMVMMACRGTTVEKAGLLLSLVRTEGSRGVTQEEIKLLFNICLTAFCHLCEMHMPSPSSLSESAADFFSASPLAAWVEVSTHDLLACLLELPESVLLLTTFNTEDGDGHRRHLQHIQADEPHNPPSLELLPHRTSEVGLTMGRRGQMRSRSVSATARVRDPNPELGLKPRLPLFARPVTARAARGVDMRHTFSSSIPAALPPPTYRYSPKASLTSSMKGSGALAPLNATSPTSHDHIEQQSPYSLRAPPQHHVKRNDPRRGSSGIMAYKQEEQKQSKVTSRYGKATASKLLGLGSSSMDERRTFILYPRSDIEILKKYFDALVDQDVHMSTADRHTFMADQHEHGGEHAVQMSLLASGVRHAPLARNLLNPYNPQIH